VKENIGSDLHYGIPLGGRGCLTKSETQITKLLWFSHQKECQQFGSQRMRNPNMVFTQVVMRVGVSSRTVPV
jgi:hypothetical protein